MQHPQLLLIEDDLSFGYILKEYLALKSYKLDWAKTGTEGLKLIEQNNYQLCILDIMLPDTDGFAIAQTIRSKFPELPFIFLSARGMKVDKLKGYQLGCDDYITKPIDEELLLVKIQVILKRTQTPTITVKDRYLIGQFLFEPEKQRLSIAEATIQLSKKENALLLALAQKEGQLTERKIILRDIWGSTDEFSRKSMDVFISKLRKYLKKDPSIQILNVHGKGFILEVKEE
ncbi:MAG: response regulator transcription factor [Bacteroidota bacterium]